MDAVSNWQWEKQSAFLYRVIAQAEKSLERKRLFEKLSDEAEKQAALWEAKIPPHESPTHFSVPFRVRFAAGLVRVLGPRSMRGILSAMKVRGMSVYQHPVGFHAIPDQVSQVGSRHDHGGAHNWLRASVFGVNDGLISNLSLILGVTGATTEPQFVLLSGVAGMLAGAFSMACGEYVSVRSQREYYEKQIAVEKDELASYPDEEAAELALIFEARGLPRAEAERSAKLLIADPSKALETLAREELGVNPADLGSPKLAAISSFVSFIIGASLPLIPFLLGLDRAVGYSVAGSAAALFGIGSAISLFTGNSALLGGLRMLVLGAFAGAATFLLGRALGVGLS